MAVRGDGEEARALAKSMLLSMQGSWLKRGSLQWRVVNSTTADDREGLLQQVLFVSATPGDHELERSDGRAPLLSSRPGSRRVLLVAPGERFVLEVGETARVTFNPRAAAA